MASLNSTITVNIRVTVNDREGVALWRVRWAYRLARLFRLPLRVEVEKSRKPR